jgi:hypothetical protein
MGAPIAAGERGLLQSGCNPNGRPLDELLAQLRREITSQLMMLDGRHEADRARLAKYEKIISGLYESEGRYRSLGLPPKSE